MGSDEDLSDGASAVTSPIIGGPSYDKHQDDAEDDSFIGRRAHHLGNDYEPQPRAKDGDDLQRAEPRLEAGIGWRRRCL